MQQTVRRLPKGFSSAAAVPVLAACATALLTGCTSGDSLMPTMAVPPPETTKSGADARGGAQPPLGAVTQPSTLIVTGRQRAYLDALRAAGVRPSSELLALSIGSYVCQARAAKQTEQAVWDYVVPLVRGDVRDPGLNAMAPPASEVNAVTADYIRIATERLC